MSWAGAEDTFLSTSLATYLDKKLLVLLRDGRKLLGLLRSFDQFGNTNISLHVAYRVLISFTLIISIETIANDGWFSFICIANVVLEGACERVIVGDLYCDIPLGLYVIRGENVVLIGELELDKEELPPHMTLVPEAEIKRAQKAERDATDLKGSMRKRMEFLDFD
ncbi:unnamed protein product [Malus baccata var. baccata]